MLDFLRRHSSSWVAKILLGLVILSFGLFWGISDIFSGHGSSNVVATAGKTKISTHELARAAQHQMQSMSQQLGHQVDLQQLKQLGILQQILRDLINKHLLDQEAKALGLVTSDEQLRKELYAEPMFKGANGQFDRARFDQLLQANRMSEKAFFDDMRQNLTRSQLIQMVGSVANVPALLAKHLLLKDKEQRVLKSAVIDGQKLVGDKVASDAELDAFFQTQKEQFTSPELRKMTLLIMDPEEFVAHVELEDEEILAEFERRKGDYSTPEKRSVAQLFSKDEAAIREVEAMVKGGRSFDGISKNLNPQVEATDVGSIAYKDLPKPIAEIIFRTGDKKFSEVFKSPMGWHIFYVKDIKKPEAVSFEKVKDKVAHDLKRQKSTETLYNLSKQVEDDIAGGATLEEVAKTHKVRLIEFDNLDAKGNDADGKPIQDKYINAQTLETIFSIGEGEDSNLSELKSGGYFIARADKITAPQLKPLSEVRAKVHALWLKKEQKDAANKVAKAIVDGINGGKSIDELAKEHKLGVVTSAPLSRMEAAQKESKDFAPEFLMSLFGLSKGKATFFQNDEKTMVAQVSDINAASVDEMEVAAYKQKLQAMLTADSIEQYFQYLHTKYGVTVNNKVLALLN